MKRGPRGILFRAWDKLNKKMYPNPFNGEIGGINDIFSNAGNWVYLQYTGQKDKDGTEVYEEDIIEVNTVIGRVPSQVLLHFTNRYVVTFENGMFTFGGYTFNNNYVEHIKVVGNTYENPELIKQEVKRKGNATNKEEYAKYRTSL